MRPPPTPPKLAQSDIVRIYKSVMARELFKALPCLRQELWGLSLWFFTAKLYPVCSFLPYSVQGDDICERIIPISKIFLCRFDNFY